MGFMLKWILLGGMTLGVADPYLLYLISDEWGFWTAFFVWLGPIIVASPLAMSARRNLAVPPESPADLASRLAEIVLIPVANLALWYPGPITSAFGLLLLIGPTRRFFARRAAGRLGGRLGGSVQFGSPHMSVFMGGMPGPMPGMSGAAGGSAAGGLKRADGRVVDETQEPRHPALPETQPADGDAPQDNSERRE